jgi:hypothetical protein
MPDNITVASVQQYKANVELLLQQEQTRLRGAVMTGSHVGKAAAFIEQFGEATAVEQVTRHEDTPLLDLSQDKRWVFPRDIKWASLIDQQDKLRMLIDPTSPYVRAGAAAMNRKIDDLILEAIFGTNFTGENGTTSETFGTLGTGTYDVGVDVGGTASGLNVAKLQAALRRLMTANKGELMEAPYAAISSYEHDLLLKEPQVTSRDFSSGLVMEDGKIKRFLGFNFIVTERLTITSGNRLIPAWLKSGMYLGIWNDLETKVSERADKSHATQVYLCYTMGATRTQLGKQIRISCDDQI